MWIIYFREEHHKIDIAVFIGVSAGVRTEQNYPLRSTIFDNPLRGFLYVARVGILRDNTVSLF